jgi:hypothetical protein
MIVDRHLLPTISSAPPIGRFLESICALLSVLRSWTTFPGAGEGCHRRSEAAAEPAAAPLLCAKRRARTQKQKGGDQLFARRSSLPNVSGITLFPSSPQGDGLSRCLCTARALASSANTLSGNAAARAKRVSQSPAPLRCDVLVIRVACG